MRFAILVAAVWTIGAQAASVSTQLNVAFGASVPKDPTGQTLLEKFGPSRANGGEHIVVRLSAAKMISDIKLTAYSAGHAGKALIHSATAFNGTTPTSLDGLAVFAKADATGKAQNYQNMVMLTDTAFVQVQPNLAMSQLDIVIEGFANNDASLLLQVTSSDGLPAEDFLVTRTGPNGGTVGSYINEANYSKFSEVELQKLMTVAADPSAADLAGKTYVCSSYTKLDSAQVNVKTRAYFDGGGVLQSHSESQAVLTWNATTQGLQAAVANFNGCGTFSTTNVLRRTAAGNLISEVVLDLESYLTLCENAGYDRAATQAVEMNSTFSSLLDPKYVVDYYEFCRPN